MWILLWSVYHWGKCGLKYTHLQSYTDSAEIPCSMMCSYKTILCSACFRIGKALPFKGKSNKELKCLHSGCKLLISVLEITCDNWVH